jgi:hypothetical protein
MIFLGSGPYAIWPVEERLVYNRIGDADNA